jgi:hypothetical protein
VGARGRRPLWSPPWVPVTFGHCFLFFLSFYSLFFIALPFPAPPLPCPALTLPCPCPSPALAPALPCFEFSFWCQGQEEEVTQGTGSVFFCLLLPGTGGRSYIGNGYLKQDRTYTWWEAFEHMQKLLSRK